MGAFTIEAYERMADLIDKRVEIPVHYDLWMRGARLGRVVSRHRGKAGVSAYLRVQMEHPQVRRSIKVWALDIDYMKVL